MSLRSENWSLFNTSKLQFDQSVHWRENQPVRWSGFIQQKDRSRIYCHRSKKNKMNGSAVTWSSTPFFCVCVQVTYKAPEPMGEHFIAESFDRGTLDGWAHVTHTCSFSVCVLVTAWSTDPSLNIFRPEMFLLRPFCQKYLKRLCLGSQVSQHALHQPAAMADHMSESHSSLFDQM